MRLFQKIVLALGLLGLAALLWSMDKGQIGRLLYRVRWGLLLIVAQEIVAHTINAFAWRLAFVPQEAAAFPFRELLRLRVIGDAINYLVPGATIPGEILRASLLNRSHGRRSRAGSVLVAKCTQSLAHCLFMVTGLLMLAHGYSTAAPYAPFLYAAATVLLLVLAAAGLLAWRSKGGQSIPQDGPVTFPVMLGWLKDYALRYPGRVLGSTATFMLAFAWGAFEAFWICRFLGSPISATTALTLETLSLAVDGFLFMVPAKMGTQEGGKTAIFVLLGLPAEQGFAFGVVRHTRELLWAGGGLLLYWRHRSGVR